MDREKLSEEAAALRLPSHLRASAQWGGARLRSGCLRLFFAVAAIAVLAFVIRMDRCTMEVTGPRVTVEAPRESGGAPVNPQDYVGLWVASKARLLIHENGDLDYRGSGGPGNEARAFKSTIEGFDGDGFIAGKPPSARRFRVDRRPHDESGTRMMTVDGIEYVRSENNRQLGRKYLDGEGVPTDPAKAREFFAKGCEDDQDETSCDHLGVLYVQGRGVPTDFPRALRLFTDLCNGGYASGCFNLAVMHDAGQGVPKDKPRAALLYEKGCNGGKADSCNNLGVMYFDGEGVVRDLLKAANLFQKACQGGCAPACEHAQGLRGQLL